MLFRTLSKVFIGGPLRGKPGVPDGVGAKQGQLAAVLGFPLDFDKVLLLSLRCKIGKFAM